VLTRFRWSELRLMLLGGLLVGVAVTRVGTGARLADGDSRSVAVTGPVRVIDGDTFDYGGMRIRIADIDTPEVDGRCAYESELAAQATARLDTLLSSGAIELHRAPGGRDEDRYGRKLRIVTRDGRSIGDALVAEGVARTWTGRREPWCGEA
jgi:endonuclease YncB( thermonuclease family)